MSKAPNTAVINTQEVFDGLAKNALGFLEQSLNDFDGDDLQQSVINFATAVELFLKARLLLEHWTLIIRKPEQANISHFKDGKFISVSQSESIERLRRAVGLTIPKSTENAFNSIWKYRNMMVHFYHPGEGDKKTKQFITGLQCYGWGHLYILLVKYWHDEFANYTTQFENIDHRISRHKNFLEGKYDGLKAHIQKEMNNGIAYETCPSCGYHAVVLQDMIYPRFLGTCRVCPSWGEYLEAKCEHCDTINYLAADWEGTLCCNTNCRRPYEMGYLLSLYGNESPADGLFTNGYCTDCLNAFSGHTVVELDNFAGYLCLSCFELYDQMDNCQRCGSNIAGSHSETGTYGCIQCHEALEEKWAAD